jgi:hypothetical protein
MHSEANELDKRLPRSLWVIFGPRGRSDTSLFVCFAPKATFTNQDVIRRFVPLAAQRAAAKHRYSMTSSASASSVGATATPSSLTVFKLITSSKLVGCVTGRSAGFSPLRMRPV